MKQDNSPPEYESSAPRPPGGLQISAWGITHPIPVTLLFIVAVLAGLICYFQLPIKNFPNIEFPLVAVDVTRNGAAPTDLETQVTRPVENALAGLTNVD